MKLYKSLFALAGTCLLGGAMVSCDDDFDRPPVVIPEATYEVNTPIADFKELYWQYASGTEFVQIPLNADGDSIIIGGHIVSTDVTGNMYKQMVVEDESGAILIGVNADLNEGRFKYGEEVRVNLTGLYVGNYNGLMQIGMPYNGSIGRIDEEIINLHAQCNGLPDPAAVNTLIIDTDIATVNSWAKNQADLRKYMSTLIRLKDVHFEGGGELAWSDNPGGQYYTTRRLIDAEGNAINVNTSNKATFAGEMLPAGDGTVTCILSYFKTDWQLVLCDPAADCTGFKELPADNIVFSAPLSSDMEGFTIHNITAPEGTAIWTLSTQYNCMVATGYINGTNTASESWLISPVIDLAGMETGYATFRHAQNYFASADKAREDCRFAIREEGSDTWTYLTINYPAYGAGFNFISAGDIDLKDYLGKKVQFGFRYTSSASKAGTWELNNFMIKKECVGDPDIPTGGTTPDQPVEPGTGIFTETFAEGLGSFTMDNILMPEALTYIWSYNASPACAKASGFVSGTAYDTESYLVSPVIDLTGAATPVLTFEHATNFFGSEENARSCTSVGIREEGTTAWTTLTVPTYPSTQSWNFVSAGDIDLKAYAGKKVQIGLRYSSAASGAGTWEVKNFVVK